MNYSKIFSNILRLCSLVVVLSACQSTPPATRAPVTTAPTAETSESITIPLPDILSPGAQAFPSDLPLFDSSDDYRLQQAVTLFLSGNAGLALDMLDSIEDNSLTTDQRTRKRILQATILLQAGGSLQAQQVLRGRAESFQPETLTFFYLVQAKASIAQGETADALKALINREQFLRTDEVVENQLLIWNILMLADKQKLLMIQQNDISVELAGWIELAIIVKKSSAYPGTEQAVNNWRISNFSHPANAIVLEQIIRETGSFLQPKRIAFLLPLTSSYGSAASAIRDGFETMNNEQVASSRYQVRYYDYGRDANATALYYNQAINDGADIVVGPLGRQSIDSLLSSTTVNVPTVLLSPPSDEQNSVQQNLYQFSLSQELEAQQTAERAWLDGHRRGVILFPQTPIGERMASAFTDRFSQLGGVIVSSASFSAEGSDYSSTVRQLLSVDRSDQRIAEMKNLLGGKITAEARRRQDIDFIFLTATSANARLIKPVLDFFYAHDLPIYSTSRIFSGKLDPVNDADLERIRFPDMPWMIATNIELESLRTFLQGSWPGSQTSYNRLYGIGMDIFSILPRLERMRSNPQLYYQGLSGNLSIDEDGTIDRQMLWAIFRKGTPTLLDNQTTYQGRFSEKRFETIPAITPAERP